jgi:phage-related minor tail protein
MVGIHKKIKQLLKVVQQYAPLLSKFVPGLGEIVESVSGVGENIVDGINNVYSDYSDAKSNKRNYGLMDGVRYFTRQSAVKN